jgi:glycosyltransferase involved in cell wall biosynthesis
MITNSKKKKYIGDAIKSFASQTYHNKELIIVHCDGFYFNEYLKNIYVKNDPRIKLIGLNKQTLGSMRNVAIEKSSGELVATWDDDDISHPIRLERQLNEMLLRRAEFSYLTKYVHLFEDDANIFLVNKLKPTIYVDCVVENTMIGFKNKFPIKYLNLNSGEDTPVNLKIINSRKIYIHIDENYLFVYRFCKSNVWNKKHHITMCTHNHVDFDKWNFEKNANEYIKVIPPGTWNIKDNRMNLMNILVNDSKRLLVHGL